MGWSFAPRLAPLPSSNILVSFQTLLYTPRYFLMYKVTHGPQNQEAAGSHVL